MGVEVIVALLLAKSGAQLVLDHRATTTPALDAMPVGQHQWTFEHSDTSFD